MIPKSHEELVKLNGTSLIYTSTVQYIYDKVLDSAKRGETSVNCVFDMENVKELMNPTKKPGILYPTDAVVYKYKYDPEHTFQEICRLFPQPTKVSITHYIVDPPAILRKEHGETQYKPQEISMYDDLFLKRDTKIIEVNWELDKK